MRTATSQLGTRLGRPVRLRSLSVENPSAGCSRSCSSQPQQLLPSPQSSLLTLPIPRGGKRRHHRGPCAPKEVAAISHPCGARGELQGEISWAGSLSDSSLTAAISALVWVDNMQLVQGHLFFERRKKTNQTQNRLKKCFPPQHLTAGRRSNITFIHTPSLEDMLLVEKPQGEGSPSSCKAESKQPNPQILPVFLPSQTGFQRFFNRPQIKKPNRHKMQILLTLWHHNKKVLLLTWYPAHTEHASPYLPVLLQLPPPSRLYNH